MARRRSDKRPFDTEGFVTAVGDTVDLLDVPRDTVKGMLSGDQEEWFSPEGKNPHVYAAGNVAGDLFLDPLNAVGGGLMAAAGRGAKQIPGAVASLSNYIPDWYGPDAMKKASGFGGWLVDSGTSAVRHMVDPVSRANWKENKITSPVQERIQKMDPATDTRATEKGVSQVQYTSGHIPVQTGSEATTQRAGKEIIDRSFLEPHTVYDKDKLAGSLQEHTVTQIPAKGGTAPTGSSKAWREGAEVELSQEDAEHVSSVIDEVFEGDIDTYSIKAPTAKETGGHFNDVIYKSPAKAALKEAFVKNMDADGNVDPETLGKWLKENTDKYNSKLKEAGRTRDGWEVDKVTEDGVWLRGGMLGSAITEGGVGWTLKVEPDGTLRGFMFDKHDFFERLGGEQIIPGKTIAVTPAMVNNIKYVGGGKGKKLTAPVRDADGNIVKDGRKQVKADYGPAYDTRQTQRKGTKEPYQALLDEYANVQPSAKGVAKERARLTGAALLADRTTDYGTDD